MLDNIIIDFDNTLADSSRAAVEYAKDKYRLVSAENYNPSELLWGFDPFVTDSEMQKDTVGYMNSEDFFNKVEIMPNAKAALAGFKKDNPSVSLTVCTNRTGQSFDFMKKWLLDHCLTQLFDHIVCVSSFDKSVLKGDVIIDDKPSCMLNDNRPYHIVFGDCRYTKKEFIENYDLLNGNGSFKFCKDWNMVSDYLDKLALDFAAKEI